MSNFRLPGVICNFLNHFEIDSGTMCRAASPVPATNQVNSVHTGKKLTSNAAFIRSAIKPAQISELETGVPASITLAQAILESGGGKHHIGTANNYFGVKAQKSSKGISYGEIASGFVEVKTREHLGSEDVFIKQPFRSYKSMTDSFRDHGLFLKKNKRYQSVIAEYAKTKNANDFAKGLQKAGYATDPNYAKLLISVMKKYNLYQYNQ